MQVIVKVTLQVDSFNLPGYLYAVVVAATVVAIKCIHS